MVIFAYTETNFFKICTKAENFAKFSIGLKSEKRFVSDFSERKGENERVREVKREQEREGRVRVKVRYNLRMRERERERGE